MKTPYADDAGILLPKKGKFTTGRSKPYIFASPQELEKVIVLSCLGARDKIYYYLIVKFYMFYKVLFIFNYFFGCWLSSVLLPGYL
jgi:hypothetical protein